MKHLLLLPLAILACSDYPASEGNESEANPININITIQSDSESTADSESVVNDGSDNVSSSATAVDNSTDNSTDNNTINIDNVSS